MKYDDFNYYLKRLKSPQICFQKQSGFKSTKARHSKNSKTIFRSLTFVPVLIRCILGFGYKNIQVASSM